MRHRRAGWLPSREQVYSSPRGDPKLPKTFITRTKGRMPHPIMDEARKLERELVTIRRDLHQHPELGFREQRTAAVVAARLEALGLPVQREVGVTGVVAELDNGTGPTIALRADMDALPIQEEGDHEYRSKVPGVMH